MGQNFLAFFFNHKKNKGKFLQFSGLKVKKKLMM